MTAPKKQREMGILMGALGGYGGAGIGAGLSKLGSTALAPEAIAAANASADPIASLVTAKDAATSAGMVAPTGFKALASGAQQVMANPSALVNQMGGLGSLAKTASMAAAPMMVEDRRQAEVPVDDEMYSYTYDVGRTGAENTPTDSSAERRYFDGRFSPVRKIRARDYAAQGGLMSLAEGGETAAPTAAEVATPTASEAALAYLMGERSSSAPARSPLIDAQLMEGVRPVPKPVVGSDNMYAFDPATGTFLRNPNIPGASTSGSPVGTSFSGSGGSYDAPMSQQQKDFFDREAPAQRDARMGEFQNLFNLGPTGALFSALRGDEVRAPNFGTLFGTGDAYKNLGYDYYQGEGGTNLPSGLSYAEAVGMGSNMAQDDRDRGEVGFSQSATSQQYGENFASGGLMGLAKGGMKSGGFVVPADVVSMIGEGNTDAGYSRIKSMIPGATAIKGKDGGQADTVKTSIEGKQPARVAHGEMYIPPETVKRMGGAKKLYAMMDRVRQQATGSKKQIKPVSLKQAMA
jgi:hypothetical protein